MDKPPLTDEPQSILLISEIPVHLGPFPTKLVCPYCQTVVETQTESQCSMCMCCVTCVWCCFAALKNQDHICPECRNFIGVYRPRQTESDQ